ncbi:MAG: metalloregulator ArsR/SmtB family transcription factor [Planctomycetota bacterium]
MTNCLYAMQNLLAITRALNDESRLRMLAALGEGELCLCQLVEFAGLAPSTVSKHVTLLYEAGLLERRKQGKWHYYRLAGRGASPTVREALRWVRRSLEGESAVLADLDALCCVKAKDLEEVTSCYRS